MVKLTNQGFFLSNKDFPIKKFEAEISLPEKKENGNISDIDSGSEPRTFGTESDLIY